jgi:hypothetical protein
MLMRCGVKDTANCCSNKLQGGQLGILRTHKGGVMQDAGYGLRRISLLRGSVNRGGGVT